MAVYTARAPRRKRARWRRRIAALRSDNLSTRRGATERPLDDRVAGSQAPCQRFPAGVHLRKRRDVERAASKNDFPCLHRDAAARRACSVHSRKRVVVDRLDGHGRLDGSAVPSHARGLRGLQIRALRPRKHGAGCVEHRPRTSARHDDGNDRRAAPRIAGHVDPILVLLHTRLDRGPESASTLAAIQIAACALGALPVYWLARKHLESEATAGVLALAYLAYPWLAWIAIEAMHPITSPFHSSSSRSGSWTATDSCPLPSLRVWR